MKLILSFFCVLFCVSTSIGQNQSYKTVNSDPEWVHYMYTEHLNLFTLRELFEDYYSNHDFVKNKHTQYFKRLMKSSWTHVDTEGYIIAAPESAEIIATQKSPTSAWQEVGPWEYDHEQAMEFSVQSPGSAHVYTVEQSPLNASLVYAGTATAGLWKSTDKGLNWSLMTRDLDVNSVYSIALDPNDEDIVYFGEGSGDIWKSIDGGVSWAKTGDFSFQAQTSFVRDLRFIGTNTLLAATNNGLFRTSDGGTNWTTVNYGEHMEIEIKPNDPTTLYTVRIVGDQTQFLKSTDTGLTWSSSNTGWPAPSGGDEQRRCEIAVTADNPEKVYVLASGDVGPDGGLYGIYSSSDAGASFTFECCGTGPVGTPTVDNPNILGWSEDGTGDGGQYYYDLALAASPTDSDKLFGAGINTWRSENGGADWSLNSHWVTWVSGGNLKHRYNHADVHDIKFFDNGSSIDMWIASDGGLYYSSNQGDSLEPRMHGIHGTDFWGFDAGYKDGYVMVGGTYHNGTLIRYKDIYKGGISNPEEGGWLAELGGDNYRGFVNYGDHKIGYHDNGAFNFSTIREERITGRGFDNDKRCNTSYVAGEYGNYEFSPHNYTTFYSPVDTKLFKTTNGGTSFEEVYDFGGSKIIQVKVAWANTDIIYVTHKPNGSATTIQKSIDGGVTWSNINPANGATGNNANRPKYIEVDDEDPNKIWCILMGGQSGYKVFQSTDGGSSWTNLTTPTIYNENMRSIRHHYGTDDGIYIGTTKRVYYKNATMPDWVVFNNNLPSSTNCLFLVPFYAGGKIRTATQRGVYECDFYEDAAPVAMISADRTSINLAADCLADTVQFVDHSTVRSSSASWQWSFEGGTPSTSSLERPKVVYDTPGLYTVQLIVSDAFGSDTIEIEQFIEVTNQYTHPAISEDFNGSQFPPENWKLYDSEGTSWEHDYPKNDEANKVAAYPNYWVDATGQQHLLILPAVDLSDVPEYSISFDYTYNDFDSYNDSLAVVYRTAASPEWQTIWIKGGADLEVDGTDTWFWDSEDPTIVWENQQLDLSFLAGESCVELAFDNRSQYGNHIWIDNVNLTGLFTGLEENSLSIHAVPNPSTGNFTLFANSAVDQLTVIDITGRQIIHQETTNSVISIDLSSQPTGVYVLNAQSATGNTSIRLIKQ